MGLILRQGKPWQGGCDELKPCTASQQVRHLPGKGAVRQPGASVAWRAATYCREAYTAGGEATLLSLEILNVDAFVFIIAGAAPEAPVTGEALAGRPGSENVCIATGWLAGEPGRPRICPRTKAGTRTTGQNKGSGPAPACGGPGAKQQAKRGTGWRINKPKGSSAGSRNACIVLRTAGNRGRRDPSEERGASREQSHGRDTRRKR